MFVTRALAVSLLPVLLVSCAAPLQRVAPRRTVPASSPSPPPKPDGRPAIGVAFGGGSARGIAHVGVIKWFEEHRIPIDVAAGTSMGGLIGGAFATGMDARELQAFIASLDWDQLFGASSFAHKNIRRKADARDYPARLEFGLRGGIVPPSALNNGEYVELMLGRIAAPYFAMRDFDELPTPFRTIAVDLLSAEPVVMRDGSLAEAMRATMSLPLIFPAVERDGQVLIDGGTMNNVPADVVRGMGADRVVAINVGELANPEGVAHTMFGIAGSTVDAMMRASTRRALTAADIVIDVPLKDYGSLDWRRAPDLIEEGYRAAEAMRDRLLPLAVSETEFAAWQQTRLSRRRTELPPPAFLELEGIAADDARRLQVVLARHVGAPLDPRAIEQDIAVIAGLDRYQTVTWTLVQDPARGYGLHVRGRLKAYAPPFMMLGFNLENTTSNDFRIAATARYLGFDIVGSGSELRVDGTIGSDPAAAAELYRPIGARPLFVAPYAGIRASTFDLIREDAVLAQYGRTTSRVGLNGGVNLGARSDVRGGVYFGHSSTSLEVGDPQFPELRGSESGAELIWRLDTQDSPVVPSGGVLSQVRLSRSFKVPDIVREEQSIENDARVTQLSGTGSKFWSRGPDSRLFVAGGLGASFNGDPLPTEQFAIGGPFKLGAYANGELRGNHYYVASGGYLRRIGRLPDFMGGPIFAGGWIENGDVFDQWQKAGWRTNGGVGIIMDTLIGPAVIAGEFGFDGRWRTYIGVGRIFR